MNQQHLRTYLNLIQQLLACPSGEEWILLRQNEALVTPELVQVMEQVATQLVNQGNLKEGKFLHNLAGQIHHLFVAQTVSPQSGEDHTQVYLELIKALLACPKGSENELLAANQDLIGPGLVQMMQQVAAQMAANGEQETASYLQHWANELNGRWLHQHGFQAMPSKPEPEPQPIGNGPIPRPSSATTVPPLSRSAVPPQDLEDFWAEAPESPVQTMPSPLSMPPTVVPPPVENGAVPASLDVSLYEQMNRHLAAIATALTQLNTTLTPPATPPTDPLWYMETLERAYTGNWILTSEEIQKLVGVKPSCPKGSDSFQRGGWVFVKAGKVGTQMGWHVLKEKPPQTSEAES